MEILDIAPVNCDNQVYCLSVPTRWPTDLLLTSSCCFFNSNFYFFPNSFLWIWSIHGTPYLFQLYIFFVTFLFKEFTKAKYLYPHTQKKILTILKVCPQNTSKRIKTQAKGTYINTPIRRSHVHTHTHTYVHLHVRTHMHMHTQACTHMHTHQGLSANSRAQCCSQ